MMAPWNFVLNFGRRFRKLELWSGVVAVVTACAGGTTDDTSVIVFAAASLTDTFDAVAQLIGSANSGELVRTNFAGSQQLALQLIQGARADVFATADERWMDTLVERQLVQNKKRFATNKLVIVARATTDFHDLATPGRRIVIGADAVPIGRYTRLIFSRLAASADYGPAFAAALSKNVASEEDNVRGVLAKVLLGEADAGFVYVTDVRKLDNDAYHVVPIPDEVNVSAEYFIGRTSNASPYVERFLRALESPEGQAILRAHGFSPT